MDTQHLTIVLEVLKLVGGGIGGLVVIVGLIKYPLMWVLSFFQTVKTINTNVSSLSGEVSELKTNHLTHIQSSLNANTETIRAIQTDVGLLDTKLIGYGERLSDTRHSVDVLNETVMKHLEHSAEN